MPGRLTHLSLALTLLLTHPWLGAPAAPGHQGSGPKDPVAELQEWVERCKRNRSELSAEDEDALRQTIADARMLALGDPDRGREVALELLDLAAARPVERARKIEFMSSSSSEPDRVRAEALAAVVELLRSGNGPALAGWVASGVLALPSANPLGRRLAAAEALKGLHLPATRLALFSCAIEPDRGLRDAAMLAFEGWDDDSVHRFLLDQLRRNAAEPGWISPRVVRRHFSSVHIPAGTEAARELTSLLHSALESRDWRAAFRALELSTALDDQDAVPELLAALRIWSQRRRDGAGRLRLEGDIVAELRRRSGRSIGLHPERWEAWWNSRRAAQAQASPPPEAAPPTVSGFFGLRPVTDRIVFVLDGSGSMANALEPGGNTRYEEATQQLFGLLKSLGESTSFRVLVFSDQTVAWSDSMRFATPTNLSALRSWMQARRPRGATHLKPGIEAAMRLDARGMVDLERLEADTVIVLCDGATEEGPQWVVPLLDGPNERACLVFHCVQIGAGGDGTLELLAARTGGEFVRVKP